MRIQHNIVAMNAYRNYNLNTSAVSKNLEKLSSGYKINRAGDDAAGLAISEKMRAQITGLDAASKNVKDGISLVKTAEGAMQEIQDMLNRMVSLATQSANGTYQDAVDRENLQAEVDQLKSEIDRIADSANFNGIKLLDGSLEGSGAAAARSVEIGGNVTSTSSAGVYGEYANDAPITLPTALAENDKFEFTVALDNNKSYTLSFTAAKDADGDVTQLIAADGTKYTITDGAPTVAELDAAILGELNKSELAQNYNITSDDAGTFTFKAKEVGTDIPKIAAIDSATTTAATGAVATEKLGVDIVQAPQDVGREISADSITVYDGTNYDDAVFTINGHKFVMLTATHTGPTGTGMDATAGLDKDVTVLVGGKDGLKAANANFAQNIAKIKEVTGLNVTDAINEVDAAGTAAATGVAPGAGIRLSANKDTQSGGLVLQIGDTSDSYNQLRVRIKDMHVKSLGINTVNIGTQAGASAAINTIKNAINTVSSVRGTLGATQNRLEHTSNNLSVMKENIQDAESTIRDTDVAEEMMAYTKNNILVQSAQAMLAQANQVPQGVLQLLG